MKKKSPSETVRATCTCCLGLKQFNRSEIEACQGDACRTGACPLFPYRLGARVPVKTFRAYCLQCMGGHTDFVKHCSTVSCPVYSFRFGKNPALMGKRTAPQAGIDALRYFQQIGRDDTKSRPESIISSRVR